MVMAAIGWNEAVDRARNNVINGKESYVVPPYDQKITF